MVSSATRDIARVLHPNQPDHPPATTFTNAHHVQHPAKYKFHGHGDFGPHQILKTPIEKSPDLQKISSSTQSLMALSFLPSCSAVSVCLYYLFHDAFCSFSPVRCGGGSERAGSRLCSVYVLTRDLQLQTE